MDNCFSFVVQNLVCFCRSARIYLFGEVAKFVSGSSMVPK